MSSATSDNPIPALKRLPMENNFSVKIVQLVMERAEVAMVFSQMTLPKRVYLPCRRWQVQKIVPCAPQLTSQIPHRCLALVLRYCKEKSYVVVWERECRCGVRSLLKDKS